MSCSKLSKRVFYTNKNYNNAVFHFKCKYTKRIRLREESIDEIRNNKNNLTVCDSNEISRASKPRKNEFVNTLIIKIDDDINKIVFMIKNILESKKYSQIILMISMREFNRTTDFGFFTEKLVRTHGYTFVLSCLPQKHLNDKDFCEFYEIKKLEKGKFYG